MHKSLLLLGLSGLLATAVSAIELSKPTPQPIARTIPAAQDTPFGRFAVLEDPWGATFSVMQLPAG